MTAKATRTLALVMSLLLMASIAVPGAVAGAQTADEHSLNLTQDEKTGDVTITVSDNGSGVENASVNVSTVENNTTYAGTGEYETDAEGTVTLDAPEESMNISVKAMADNSTVSNDFFIEAPSGLYLSVGQADDYSVIIDLVKDGDAVPNETVNVTGDYEYSGSHTTDDSGTVELPAPVNDTTINVSATVGDETAERTNVEILVRNDSNPNNDFAQALVAFIHSLDIETIEGPPGQKISEFVHEHNPSNADNNAGPPEHAGPPDDAGPKNETLNATEENATDGQGPPPSAGPPENKTDKPGPPDEKGPNKDD